MREHFRVDEAGAALPFHTRVRHRHKFLSGQVHGYQHNSYQGGNQLLMTCVFSTQLIATSVGVTS